jgi:hypothetical protein
MYNPETTAQLLRIPEEQRNEVVAELARRERKDNQTPLNEIFEVLLKELSL